MSNFSVLKQGGAELTPIWAICRKAVPYDTESGDTRRERGEGLQDYGVRQWLISLRGESRRYCSSKRASGSILNKNAVRKKGSVLLQLVRNLFYHARRGRHNNSVTTRKAVVA